MPPAVLQPPGDGVARYPGAVDPTGRVWSFLERRTHADLAAALDAGDFPLATYLRQSLLILDGLRAPAAGVTPELMRFLCRWARGYVEHPEFESAWLLVR